MREGSRNNGREKDVGEGVGWREWRRQEEME